MTSLTIKKATGSDVIPWYKIYRVRRVDLLFACRKVS